MSDISVSRHHAILKYSNGSFYVEDNFSKFGTVILVQNDLLFHYEKPVSLLIGTVYLNISLNRTCLAALKCYQ